MKRNTIFKWAVVYVFILASCSSDDSPNTVNTGPTITVSDFTLTIDENPENNLILGQIDASISSGTLTYILGNQQPYLAMNIDANTGILTVRDSALFNFEVHPILTAKVYVTNGDKQEVADITITLNNIYEKYSYIGNVQLDSQQDVNSFGAENNWGISGLLLIGNNQGDITDLSPLSSLINVGTLQIEDLDITSFEGLNNIVDIEFSLNIIHNTSLLTLEGLSNNLTIGYDLSILENYSLTSLNGLPSFSNIGRDLIIRNNNQLNDITALFNINEVGRDFILRFNSQLNDLSPLSNLYEIGRNFFLFQNDQLSSLSGLENLTHIGGNFDITNQIFITEINGLSNLQTVMGNLSIINNPQLTNLCGIENLISNNGLDGDYTVEGNVYNPTLQDIIDGNCSN